jgi:hypothetical protein
MKNHVLRPLFVVIAGVALLLIVRHFMVPADFGVEKGGTFTYNFHRLSSSDDWKNFASGAILCCLIPPASEPSFLALTPNHIIPVKIALIAIIRITPIWRICNELLASRFLKKYL